MYVNVELDGKPRRLRYQYNDIADVEEKARHRQYHFNEDRIISPIRLPSGAGEMG